MPSRDWGVRVVLRMLTMCKLVLSALLVLLAASERLWLDLGPNVELITVSSLLAAVYLGGRYGAGVALVSLAISDYFLGNTRIFLFTWSAFLVIATASTVLRRYKAQREERFLVLPAIAGIYSMGGALFFYAWTNFGVWLISGMYAPTLQGLLMSYYMALPFLKWHLLSNIVIMPVGFVAAEAARVILSARLRFTSAFLELEDLQDFRREMDEVV